MGDCAEMVLDGILDWDGSYSGNDYGYSYKPMVNLTTCMQYLKQVGFKRPEKREKLFTAYQLILNQPSWNKTANLIRTDKTSWKAFKKWVFENSKEILNS